MKGLSRLKDIERAMRAMWREDQEYARTLLGRRTRGSTTSYPLFELGFDGWPKLAVRDRPIEYVGEGQRGASIYRAAIEELCGTVGACALEDLSDLMLERVRVRRGAHGYELYIPEYERDRRLADEITFVVGPDYTLWTWHPGPALEPLSPRVAVKLDLYDYEEDR